MEFPLNVKGDPQGVRYAPFCTGRVIEKAESLDQINGLKKLKGGGNYCRLRIGNLRVGLDNHLTTLLAYSITYFSNQRISDYTVFPHTAFRCPSPQGMHSRPASFSRHPSADNPLVSPDDPIKQKSVNQ